MIGDRWQRGLDPTSTVDGYKLGLRLRVLPALGHLPLLQITAGMIDRTIDQWETQHSASTIKNTIAPLVRVLDEAVRDDLLPSNPARNRSRRSLGKSALNLKENDQSPRVHALKDLGTLTALADRCREVHQSYSDFVMLCALLAARGSEISGLQVGDIDWDQRIVTIRRQTYPGAGGLVTKQTKGRDIRHVPILQALTPVLERLTADREQPGSPTPASPSMSSKASSGTSPSRPPAATCTPTPDTSPTPRSARTRSSTGKKAPTARLLSRRVGQRLPGDENGRRSQ